MDIRIFLDHSVIEVFIDRITVFSCRVYPTREESQKCDFLVNVGKVEIIELNAWKLKSMNELSSTEVCEPLNLPNMFRKLGSTTHSDKSYNPINQYFDVYPNPAKDYLFLNLKRTNLYPSTLKICDVFGKNVLCKQLNDTDLNYENNIKLDISSLSDGLYLLNISNEKEQRIAKFLIKR